MIYHSRLLVRATRPKKYLRNILFSDGQKSFSRGPGVDYAEIKAATLAVMAKDFAQEHRSLQEWDQITFWVDKAPGSKNFRSRKLGG